MILTGVVGVSAANTLTSNGVLYSNTGSSVTTVEGALNELYANYNSLLAKGNASASEILFGKTSLVKGKEVTGTMPNNGSVSKALNAGGSYTIPKGYHDGTGKVTANTLASQTSATASASDILSGQTAYVNGSKVTGTMTDYGREPAAKRIGVYNNSLYLYVPDVDTGTNGVTSGEETGKITRGIRTPLSNFGTASAANVLSGQTFTSQNGLKITGTMTNNGSVSKSLTAGGSYTIPAGYHDGTGKVTANTLASQTSATATAAQILSGKTAYVNGSKVTGTMQNYANNWIWTDKGIDEYTYNSGAKADMVWVGLRSDYSDIGSVNKNSKFIVGTKNDIKNVVLTGKNFLGVDGTATSDANATAGNILKDKTAYVNGSKVTGTMANRGAVSSKITAGGSYTIPAGYHNGSGKVSVTHTIKSWCPNYGNWVNSSDIYTTDTYTVNATSLYILVRAENGGTVYQQAAPSCSDGTITLLVNNENGILYYVNKTAAATFQLSIGIRRNYSSTPNATLKVFAFANN